MKKNIGKLLKENEKNVFSYIDSSKLLAFGLCVALTSIGIPAAKAASATWIGAADSTLETGSNWSTGAIPAANGDVMTFNSATSLGTLTWSSALGPGFGSTLGLDLIHQGAGSLTLDSSAGSVINVGDIVIDPGAGAFTLGNSTGLDGRVQYRNGDASATFINNSSNTATLGSGLTFASGGGTARNLTFGGTGDWVSNANLSNDNNGNNTIIIKNGAGRLTLNANQTFADTRGLTIDAGTLALGAAGRLGSGTYAQPILNNGVFSYASALTQTLSGVVSGPGLLTVGAGSLTLTGVNTYSGATTVTGGTLLVGGAGEINSTSGIVINGAGARYSHTSSVPSNRAITVSNGTLDGTGTVGAVTVADNVGSIVTRGNGGTGPLTIATLTFQGDATVSLTKSDVPAAAEIVVGGSLTTTPAGGTVRLDVSLPFWSSGVFYNLISAGGFSGSASHFTPGTIGGLTSRQSASVAVQGSDIGLTITGDTPRWTGANGGVWSTSSTGNWQLIIGGTPTIFINGDLVLFDDTATNASVSIASGGVSPSLVRFDNSALAYTVGGAGGIVAGSVTKDGSASVTLTSANSYTGGTIINAGTLALSGAGTLGASTANVTVNGGTLDLGTTSQTLGTVAVAGDASLINGDLAATVAGTGTSGSASVSSKVTGAGSVVMNGVGGALTLTAANDYTGGTTVSAGTLALSGAGTLGAHAGSVSVSGGVLDLGATSQTVGTVTMSGPGMIQNGTLTATSVVSTLTTGTAVVAADLTGSGSVTSNAVGGILALAGANTYTGATTVAAGTLQLGIGEDTGSILPGSPISVASGAVFAVRRIVPTVQGTDFGPITGAGGFTQGGASTTTLTVPNSYTGPTSLTAGTLVVTANGALGTGAVNINGFGNRLHLSGGITLPNLINTGGGVTVENVSGNNTITGAFEFANVGNVVTTVRSTADTLTIGGDLTISALLNWTTANRVFDFVGAGDIVVDGAIHNSLTTAATISLTKNGAGTLTLNDVSDYTGTTFIYGGVLRLNGELATNATTSTASEVTVELDGTLGGTGSIAGNTSVYGILRPAAGGEPGGRIRFDGSLNLDLFATTRFDFAGAVFTGVTSTKDAGVTYGGTLRLNFASGIYNGAYPLFELTGTPGGDFSQALLTTGVETDVSLVQAGSIWSVESGGVTYSFDEATGMLTVTGATDAVIPGATALTAAGGDGSVNLSWTSATAADSYVLQRSTVPGGPYTTIANGLGGLSYADGDVVNGTTYHYVVMGKDSASGLTGPVSAEASATPEAAPFSPLQSWRFDSFGVHDDDETVLAGDAEDFDADGIANLVEYALGTDATAANVIPVSIDRSGNFLSLSYPRRSPADPAINYVVQGSNDLASGFVVGAGTTDTVGSVSTYTDTVDLSATGARRFLRLSVSYTPVE